jgi:hypothetical protein
MRPERMIDARHRALHLGSVPDHTTPYRRLRRLGDYPRSQRGRALVETIFSVAKRKLSCRAPGRCLLTHRRQALLLGLTYNPYRL